MAITYVLAPTLTPEGGIWVREIFCILENGRNSGSGKLKVSDCVVGRNCECGKLSVDDMYLFKCCFEC